MTRFSNQRFQHHRAESCATYLASFEATNNSFLLIEKLEDQRPIGTATVYRNSRHCTADIGMMLGERSCWGQGYGREAWKSILEAMLVEAGMRKVTCGTARLNRAMIRIMEQSGMKLEGVRSRLHFCRDQRKLQPRPTNSLGKIRINTS